MDEWHVGDPSDWGDSVGVPDIPYMGYINNGEDEDEPQCPQDPNVQRARTLKEEAWRLKEDGRYEDALALINRAIELDRHQANYYNVKAIILEFMGQYSRALNYYDIAIEMRGSRVFQDNKARLLQTMAYANSYSNNLDYSLGCINDALKITNDEEDRKSFLQTKAILLEKMGKPVDAKACNYLAAGRYDMVEKTERQTDIIKGSKDTLICIAGTNFYKRQLKDGDIVDLIAEPENEHDRDAIRIEKDGETVGYVANSRYALIDEAKGASEIKSLMKPDQKAQFMFIYLDEYRIARLL